MQIDHEMHERLVVTVKDIIRVCYYSANNKTYPLDNIIYYMGESVEDYILRTMYPPAKPNPRNVVLKDARTIVADNLAAKAQNIAAEWVREGKLDDTNPVELVVDALVKERFNGKP